VQSELLTRWDEQFALTSTTGTADADIVGKVCGGGGQRWVTDPVAATARVLSIPGTGTPSTRDDGVSV